MRTNQVWILAGASTVGVAVLIGALLYQGEGNPDGASSTANPEAVLPAKHKDSGNVSSAVQAPARFIIGRPLREQLVEELSALYEGSPPNLASELLPHREVAGPILMEILRNPATLESHLAKRLGIPRELRAIARDSGRARAAALLAEMNYPGTRDALISATLESHTPPAIYYQLGRLGGPGAAAALVKALERTADSDAASSRFIIEGLGYVGDRAALPALEGVISAADDSYLRRLAECSRRAILLANDPGMVDKALKLLHSQGSKRPYSADPDAIGNFALQYLHRKRPPGLAENLRKIMDAEKRKPKEERHAGWEKELLLVLREMGESLTSTETQFLAAWDRGGCIVPPAQPPD